MYIFVARSALRDGFLNHFPVKLVVVCLPISIFVMFTKFGSIFSVKVRDYWVLVFLLGGGQQSISLGGQPTLKETMRCKPLLML